MMFIAPGEDVVEMAQYLEAVARQELEKMPQVDIELPPLAAMEKCKDKSSRKI